MRRKNWWLAGGALVVGVSQSLVSFAFKQVTCARKQTNQQCLEAQERAGALQLGQLADLPRKRVDIESRDGLRLRGWLLPGQQPVQRVIILVHGYTAAASWMLHLALPFLRRGWTVLLVDQRAHGASEGRYASYGYHEKHDLHLWVNWVIQQYGEQVIIGLLGQSMGGGTVLEYAALNRQVSFIVADCAYSDLRQLIAYQIGTLHHLPVRPLLQLLDRQLRRRVGFALRDVSPLSTIRQHADLPVMFIHGEDDTFVPTKMSVDMFQEKPGKKKLLIVPGAGHARAHITDAARYEQELFGFIAEVLGQEASELTDEPERYIALREEAEASIVAVTAPCLPDITS